MSKYKYLNREITWLSFNHRVLQEARDKNVPVYEKLKFMAIFSSNLDEFFRVRVAALRNLLALKEKTQKKLDFSPPLLLKEIHTYVHKQQEELGSIYRNIILPELKKNKIILIQENDLSKEQTEFITQFFKQEVAPFVQPVFLFKDKVNYFLQNNILYFAVKLNTQNNKPKNKSRFRYAVIEIPTRVLPRFISLPEKNEEQYIMFLDDIIRANLTSVFPGYQVDSAFAVKLTRDAELYIDDEFAGDLVEKIKKGIKNRKTGIPSRFLYDLRMPKSFLRYLRETLQLNQEDLVPGGRYHNFSDFFYFPMPVKSNLQYDSLPPLRHPSFSPGKSVFDVIKKQDILLHFPYHNYQPVINFIESSAQDPAVTAIFITLYRVASGSKIVDSLIRAAENGKRVTAFVEVKARFDEESNIRWAEEMQNSGVKVLYSFPGLKVHAKMCLVCTESVNFAYLATGNFNEKTARLYTDFGFFTARKEITNDMKKVFTYLTRRTGNPKFKSLLVAPFNLRQILDEMIDNEIRNAKEGKPAGIILKLNNLQDKKIINRLYLAGQAGVKITLLIRGICCLVPGVKNLSTNIEAFSVVDRFLEHTRIYIFHNQGRKKYFLSSADWMSRNLNRRIEVAFPITDVRIKSQIARFIELQMRDNTKSRILSQDLKNSYRKTEEKEIFNAQLDTYDFLQNQ
jgi:polyphosphate kinase